jgi:hypothetical protein
MPGQRPYALYDFLLSADFVVDDADAALASFVEVLGLPDQDPRWRMAGPRNPYVAWMARVQRSMAHAPTRLEIISVSPAPVADPEDPALKPALDNVIKFQGAARPVKTHATVLVSSHFDEILTRLSRRRVPYRLSPKTEEMSLDRVWVGVSADGAIYDPSYDAGLAIEILPVGPFGAVYKDPTSAQTARTAGGLVRVESRSFLVRDLDSSLRALSLYLDLEADGPVELIADDGYRRARMRLGLTTGCALELVEPVDWSSPAGRYLATWGPGPWTTRLTVDDLDSTRNALLERQIPFEELKGTVALGGRDAVRLDPTLLGGALFELVSQWGTR